MTNHNKIHCCQCDKKVNARLTSGVEIYPHRGDLSDAPFWVCDACGNYVGCHHKSKDPTKPLGVIPSPEIRELRKQIHDLIDPLWKTKRFSRTLIYKLISNELGYEYHTGEIRTVNEAKKALHASNKVELFLSNMRS